MSRAHTATNRPRSDHHEPQPGQRGGGIAHVPRTGAKGLVLFGMNYGTLHGFDEKGQLAGVIDNAFYYGIAEQHGLHAHLPASARTRNLIGATA